MQLEEIKKLVDTYHKAGRNHEECVAIVSAIPIDGEQSEAFEYIDFVYQKAPEALAEPDYLTDLGNAERLVRRHGKNLRYCYKRRKWLVWTGKIWEWDDGDRVLSLAKQTVRSIYAEVANELNYARRQALVKHAQKSEAEIRLAAMVTLAQSEPNIPIDITALDADPWLLNCQNGTIDLQTGELKAHERGDLITAMVPVNYDPDAHSELWAGFLDTITGNNKELAEYLRRAVGYSLTGNSRSQVVFFLYGLGCNGKSTFLTAIRKVMAGYAMQVSTELFVTGKNKYSDGALREDLALLQGKRFVAGIEIEEGKRLSVALIKAMTGGEAIRADRKYEHRIEFQPTHKIWLSGNHKPTIPDTTYAIWRRVKLIPFTVTILEPDESFPIKLEGELPAILTWAVKGCLDWQGHGLKEPEEVTAATEVYRYEQDILVEFLEDCCVLKPTATVSKADLRQAYERWCDDTDNQTITQRTFRDRLMERGITEGRGSGGMKIWRGIRLLESGEVTEVTEKSLKSYMRGNHKKFMENQVTNVTNEPEIPEYPHEPCYACGGTDFWLDFTGKRWVCERCHPQPGSNDNAK